MSRAERRTSGSFPVASAAYHQKGRFIEEQIAFASFKVENGPPPADVCRPATERTKFK
jgi:hypothetical protein